MRNISISISIILSLMFVNVQAGDKIKVKISAYTSHKSQTSGNSFQAAWGLILKRHHKKKVIAISRDLLKRFKLKNGQKVHLKTKGFSGYVIIADKMHSRWKNKVDLYFYTSKKEAIKWGVKKGTLTI